MRKYIFIFILSIMNNFSCFSGYAQTFSTVDIITFGNMFDLPNEHLCARISESNKKMKNSKYTDFKDSVFEYFVDLNRVNEIRQFPCLVKWCLPEKDWYELYNNTGKYWHDYKLLVCKDKLKIPSNAYASGDSWKCNNGFFKYGDACLKLPDNAYASGDSWKCNSGYEQLGNTCKKKITIPPNAYASGDSWKCNSGYEQLGNTCKKKSKPKKEVIPEEVLQAASGTGFIVSEAGHIITNHHVTEGCSEIKVHKDGDVYKGKVIANDILNDLALIKSNYKPNVIFPLRDKNPSLLEDIYVAGFPFGNAISSSVKVTKGVVSSESGIGNNYSNIQIDAALQPGNSGGPILDSKGNVIGVAVAKLAMEKIYEDFGVFPENTNFGIKSSVVENLIQAHNVNNPSPNTKEMSKSDLGYNIKQATLYLSCWMTLAQIKKFSTKKVIFRDLVN